MTTPTVRQVTKDDILDARAWLRKYHPYQPRRAWIDCEHTIERLYAGGLKAFLNRNAVEPT